MAWFALILQAIDLIPGGPLPAWVQSLIGNIALVRLFAIFKSAGMGDYGVRILVKAINMLSALMGYAFARFAYSDLGQGRETDNFTYTQFFLSI
ncbi:hypothetical protein QSH57_007479 [Fusarium oxysporum f. sp. vasinfectum]|nr:hypothetical protein QSH57_007479 [Fusarium oxysporum f. sp. vasinfectum]